MPHLRCSTIFSRFSKEKGGIGPRRKLGVPNLQAGAAPVEMEIEKAVSVADRKPCIG